MSYINNNGYDPRRANPQVKANVNINAANTRAYTPNAQAGAAQFRNGQQQGMPQQGAQQAQKNAAQQVPPQIRPLKFGSQSAAQQPRNNQQNATQQSRMNPQQQNQQGQQQKQPQTQQQGRQTGSAGFGAQQAQQTRPMTQNPTQNAQQGQARPANPAQNAGAQQGAYVGNQQTAGRPVNGQTVNRQPVNGQQAYAGQRMGQNVAKGPQLGAFPTDTRAMGGSSSSGFADSRNANLPDEFAVHPKNNSVYGAVSATESSIEGFDSAPMGNFVTEEEPVADEKENKGLSLPLWAKEFNKKEMRQWLLVILGFAIVIVFLFTVVLDICRVDRNSMLPTVVNGDNVVVGRLAYRKDEPQRGDIVKATFEDGVYCFRVIATAGEEIRMSDGDIYINGEPFTEDYTLGETAGDFYGRVPEGSCFVLGDNREASRDSRDPSLGYVSYDNIDGKLLWRVWPLGRTGSIYEQDEEAQADSDNGDADAGDSADGK